MKKYKLFIFDLDGTIADTSEGVLNCIRYTQKMMGLPKITKEQMLSHIGPPLKDSYIRNYRLSGENLKKAIEYHKEYAVKYGYKELCLYSGIVELLNEIKSKGCYVAAATLKLYETAVKIFDELNITNKFDVIACANFENLSTKCQLLNYCIDKLNIPKEQCILIGDSCYDAVGAEKVGIDFAAVTYGFGFKNANDVSSYIHTFVCGSVSELSDFCRKIM